VVSLPNQLPVGLDEQSLHDLLRQELIAEVVAVEIPVVCHLAKGIVHGQDLPRRPDLVLETGRKPMEGVAHGRLTVRGQNLALGNEMIPSQNLGQVLPGPVFFKFEGEAIVVHVCARVRAMMRSTSGWRQK